MAEPEDAQIPAEETDESIVEKEGTEIVIPRTSPNHKPPAEMSSKERWEASQRSTDGSYPIFLDEEADPPLSPPARILLGTTFLEVPPEELISVASKAYRDGDQIKDTVQRAYALITEAHVLSRNIQHWNNKVRRNHCSELIHSLVEESARENDGTIPRILILSELLRRLGRPTNEDDASKLFNDWIRYKVRLDEFRSFGPYCELAAGKAANYDPAWLHLPEATAPASPTPRQPKADEHETAPWWSSKDAWWPEPSGEGVERMKSESLNKQKTHFTNPYEAMKCLERFVSWIAELPRPSQGPHKPMHSKNTGRFVSPKDKGARRDDDERFKSASD